MVHILVEWCLHLERVLSGAALKATEDVFFAGQNSCEVAEKGIHTLQAFF